MSSPCRPSSTTISRDASPPSAHFVVFLGFLHVPNSPKELGFDSSSPQAGVWLDFLLEGEGDMTGVRDGEDGRKDGMILCDCGCELLELSITSSI